MREQLVGAARRRATLRHHALGFVATLLGAYGVSACIFDEGDRCGPNMVLREGFCVCGEGSSFVAGECVLVEVPPPPPTTGPGTPCDPAVASSCPDPLYPSCQAALNGDHYCTSLGCKESSECPATYRCETNGSASFCRRPYRGQGAACATIDNCAGNDANVCATLIMKCVVPNCPMVPCDPDHTCFDASSLSPGAPKLCIESSLLQR